MRYLVSLIIVFVGSAIVSAGERKPNIIVLLADDMGWGDVSFNGRKEWTTPNLDKLASRGTKFTRWYTAGVVCAPSRAALLTGKHTIHCGVWANGHDLPRSEVTLARALKNLGYVTGLFGKWHHGQPRDGANTYVLPMDHGFDEFFGYTNAKHAWEKYPKQLWHGRELKDVKAGSYADTMFTDKSIDFVSRNKDRPFFLYLPFVAPHFYVEGPEEDVKPFIGKFKESDAKKPVNANYAGMITRLDKEVGRLLQKLDDLGLTENTIIIFTSDHGATFEAGNMGASMFHRSNFPFRGQKRTLWEGGIRVPALIAWKGQIPAGKTNDDPIHMTDLMPTLLNAAKGKAEPDWKVDGQNMLAVWKGERKAPERTLFWEWRMEKTYQIAAMRGPIKFIITGKNGAPAMYNVVEDPGETRNIIDQHRPLAQQLERELRDWLATQRK